MRIPKPLANGWKTESEKGWFGPEQTGCPRPHTSWISLPQGGTLVRLFLSSSEGIGGFLRGQDPAQRGGGISEREGQLQRERVRHSARNGDFREGMETQKEDRGLQRGDGNLAGG